MPLMLYLGFAEGKAEYKNAKDELVDVRLAEWWSQKPEAGPAEPTTSADDMVPKPSLTLCAWPDGGIPSLPDAVKNKFSEDSGYYKGWQQRTKEFQTKLKQTWPNPGSNLPDRKAAPGIAPEVDGPDFSVPPVPASMDEVELASITEADFKKEDVLYTCKAQRFLPVVSVTKGHSHPV